MYRDLPIVITFADHLALRSAAASHGLLRSKLARATLVSARAVPPDVATLDSLLDYRDETEGKSGRVTLSLSRRADHQRAGCVSVTSPLGTALLGLSAGAVAYFDHADGTRHRVRLEHVVHQPERTLGLFIGA